MKVKPLLTLTLALLLTACGVAPDTPAPKPAEAPPTTSAPAAAPSAPAAAPEPETIMHDRQSAEGAMPNQKNKVEEKKSGDDMERLD